MKMRSIAIKMTVLLLAEIACVAMFLGCNGSGFQSITAPSTKGGEPSQVEQEKTSEDPILQAPAPADPIEDESALNPQTITGIYLACDPPNIQLATAQVTCWLRGVQQATEPIVWGHQPVQNIKVDQKITDPAAGLATSATFVLQGATFESLAELMAQTTFTAQLGGQIYTVASPAAPPYESKAVTLPLTQKYIPPSTGGNIKDFLGYGPDVTINIKIYVKNDRELWMDVSMAALETGDTSANATKAEGTGQFKIYEHPTSIVAIGSPATSTFHYVDTDFELDTFNQPATDLVKQYQITGDTFMNDAGITTGVQVEFNTIQLLVKKP